MRDSVIASELNTGEGERRFKYQSFKTRVEHIKIDVVHRVKRYEEDPDEHGSYFNEALEEWKEKNLTTHFTLFVRDIQMYVKTLPSILYHKERLVACIEKHLQVPDSLALDAILDLTTKLAKDLESEFYPYFGQIFAAIVPLIKHRDIKILESVFNCIAYLFKYLSRQLTNDLCPTFAMLAPLLGEDNQQKPYIRHFAAESFAFLLRKARGKDLTLIMEYILERVRQKPNEEFVEGVSMLFFECIKQVDHQLHSRGVAIFKELIIHMYREDVDSNSIEENSSYRVLSKTTLLIIHHTYRQHITQLLDMVLSETSSILVRLEQKQSVEDLKTLSIIIHVLVIAVTARKSSRVPDHKPITACLQRIADIILVNNSKLEFPFLTTEFFRLATAVFALGTLENCVGSGKVVLDRIADYHDGPATYGFVLGLAKVEWPNFTQIMLPYIVKLCTLHYKKYFNQTVLFVAELLETKAIRVTPGMISSNVTPDGLIRFPTDITNGKKGDKTSFVHSLLDALREEHDWEHERDVINNVDVEEDVEEISKISVVSAILSIISHVQISPEETLDTLVSLFESLNNALSKIQDNSIAISAFTVGHKNFSLESLMGMVIKSITNVSMGSGQLEKLPIYWDRFVNHVLIEHPGNEMILHGVYTFMDALQNSKLVKDYFKKENLPQVYQALCPFLSSYRSNERLYILKILALYEQLPMELDADHREYEECDAVNVMLTMEEVTVNIKDYRDKVLHLRKLGVLLGSERVPEFYFEAICRIALGLLTINFQPLWAEATAILETAAKVAPRLYWKYTFNEIQKFDNQADLIQDGFAPSATSLYFAPPAATSGQATKTGGLSFECPNLNKFIRAEDEATNAIGKDQAKSLAMLFVKTYDPANDRMDYWNYYTLILKIFAKIPTVTEQHNKTIIPVFLRFLETEYYTAFDGDIDEETEESKAARMDVDWSQEIDVLERSARISKQKMIQWLQIFASFKSSKSMYKSDELRDVFLRLLTKGDPKLQAAALKCLYTWKNPSITPYADNLNNLVDETRFRDELSTFMINYEQNTVDPAHRKDLMPVVMRVLYGRMVQRKGKGAAKGNMGNRRKAVLGAVACCEEDEVRFFIHLMLEPFKPILELPNSSKPTTEFDIITSTDVNTFVPYRKQLGFLNILDDVLTQLSSNILPTLHDIIKVTLYLIHSASNKAAVAAAESSEMEVDEQVTSGEDNPDEDEVEETGFKPEDSQSQSRNAREVRLLGIKRLVTMFNLSGSFDFAKYLPSMFSSFISTRLPKFALENTQAPSSLLELFYTWSSRREYLSFLSDYNPILLPQVFSILAAKKLRERVHVMVLDIIDNVLDNCQSDTDEDKAESKTLTATLLVANIDILLTNLEHSLVQSRDDAKFGKEKFSVREIAIVSRISSYVDNGRQATTIVDLLLPCLKKNPRVLSEKTKANVLEIWARFLPIIPDFKLGSDLFKRYYSHVSLMLSVLQGRQVRLLLIQVFNQFAAVDGTLSQVADLLVELNAFSDRRIDEPDFDRRLDAFAKINQDLNPTFTHQQWLPLLHQCLFNMHDPEEMAIRGTASLAAMKFIDNSASPEHEHEKEQMLNLISHVVYPGIKKGLASSIELVRVEFITVLDHAVKVFPELPHFADLVCLQAAGDEEANFFNNIYHMQIHRRLRSLGRLSEAASNGNIKASSINNIFVPILTHFIFESDQVTDHNIINQSIMTFGVLAGQLPWNSYYRLLKQYLKMIPKKNDLEKVLVRLVTSILDSFHFDLTQVQLSEESVQNIMKRKKIIIEYMEEPSGPEAEEEEEIEEDKPAEQKDLAERIHDTVVTKLLPELHRYLTNKDETSATLRVPVALGMTKVLKALPESSMRVNLPGLLTSVCQILKSRQQDARDSTRDTLIKINNFLGPTYFPFILKEMQAALQRGYQLHVLGFTLNSLLTDMVPKLNVGDLDFCLLQIVDILVNDIFGETGEEKETDEITGKIKEAKTNRSFSSFELMAQITDFKKLPVMLIPLREIMSNTESLSATRKIDETLNRISLGLNRSAEFDVKEILIFSHRLISQNAGFSDGKAKKKSVKSQMEKNFEVQTKRDISEPVDHYRTNAFRFVYFGLSILLTALKRNRFDPKLQEHLQMLDPFVNVVGNCLYSTQTTLVVTACKVLIILCKWSLPSIPESVPVLVKQMFVIIKGSGNTNSNLIQTSFKLLTVCIRDRSESSLTEHQLTYIINLIRPDLEEPEKQTTTFALIRAIISRKFMAPEVYDLMENVAEIMVTSQGKEARDLCRGVLYQFLMEYPQGRGKLRQQMGFLAKNLDYAHESGRESVMEMLHVIFNKFGDDILMEYAEMFFVALVLRLVNDESSKCREMAGTLIKVLLVRMDQQRITNVYKLLEKWLADYGQRNLQRAACQVYGLAVDAFGDGFKNRIPQLLARLHEMLQLSKDLKNKYQESEDDDEDDMALDLEWEVGYYALNTYTKIVKHFPAVIYSESVPIWNVIEDHILHPHTWIRIACTRLFGLYFANVNPETRQLNDAKTTISYLTRSKLRLLATRFTLQLKSKLLTEDLGTQIVKNLFYIGKCFYLMPTSEDVPDVAEETTESYEAAAIDNAEADEDKDEDEEAGINGVNTTEDAGEQDEKMNGVSDVKASKPSLTWLFNKESFLARGAAIRGQKNILLRTCVFKWFAAMMSIMKPEEINPFLISIVSPLYRTAEDEDTKGTDFGTQATCQ
ncbi:armadillo-type protein [Umbelopsis sp. PMI_123]|nr:armadillo-type protein [Umbelopsis sp. PMI_123]